MFRVAIQNAKCTNRGERVKEREKARDDERDDESDDGNPTVASSTLLFSSPSARWWCSLF